MSRRRTETVDRASQDRGRGVRRIGYFNGGPQSLHDAFKGAMRDLDYFEGQNRFLDERVGIASGTAEARKADRVIS